MQPEPERRGRIEYSEQGFILHWDETGLQIQVTDYHAGRLRLLWKDILALARIANAEDMPEEHDH